MTTTPASLLARLRQPADQEAWSRFVDLYTPLLYTWATRAGLQANDAADLIQDVFTKLITILPSFDYDRHRSFRAWLRTIVMNHWRDGQRRKAVRANVGPQGLDNVAVPAEAEAVWDAEYHKHVVGRAIATLKDEMETKTWDAFWATTVDGQKPAVVAQQSNMSIGAVYAAKHRVLRRLREFLAELMT